MMKTLYHPRFEPNENWLRALLLFYETVHSIVPKGADYVPSSGVAALCDEAQDTFVPLAPSEEDLAYDWDNYYALADVLRNFLTKTIQKFGWMHVSIGPTVYPAWI